MYRTPRPTPCAKTKKKKKKLDLSSINRNKMFRAWELLGAPFSDPVLSNTFSCEHFLLRLLQTQ